MKMVQNSSQGCLCTGDDDYDDYDDDKNDDLYVELVVCHKSPTMMTRMMKMTAMIGNNFCLTCFMIRNTPPHPVILLQCRKWRKKLEMMRMMIRMMVGHRSMGSTI